MRGKISNIVLANLKDFNETFEKDIPIELGESIPLFGKDGVLDSLGLVSLIVMIEQSIEDELDISIILADEKAMSQKSSPFLTSGTLIEYILTILDKESQLWISQ
ncbi:acyl carrier protein [Bacillus sp. 1P02SD]|uniref:acyl carrier protein n=1 Tax=Bacillus sp. 1P02SD TaxID=3132264 RepID=UPI0039A0CEBF